MKTRKPAQLLNVLEDDQTTFPTNKAALLEIRKDTIDIDARLSSHVRDLLLCERVHHAIALSEAASERRFEKQMCDPAYAVTPAAV